MIFLFNMLEGNHIRDDNTKKYVKCDYPINTDSFGCDIVCDFMASLIQKNIQCMYNFCHHHCADEQCLWCDASLSEEKTVHSENKLKSLCLHLYM